VSATKWVPVRGEGRSLMTELELVDEDGKTVPMYRVWSSDCPEQLGNPMKIKPETLRRLGYKPEDE